MARCHWHVKPHAHLPPSPVREPAPAPYPAYLRGAPATSALSSAGTTTGTDASIKQNNRAGEITTAWRHHKQAETTLGLASTSTIGRSANITLFNTGEIRVYDSILVVY